MKKFDSCRERIENKELKACFQKKKVLLSTRQFPNLRKLLTTSKFERLPIPKEMKQVGFFPCAIRLHIPGTNEPKSAQQAKQGGNMSGNSLVH